MNFERMSASESFFLSTLFNKYKADLEQQDCFECTNYWKRQNRGDKTVGVDRKILVGWCRVTGYFSETEYFCNYRGVNGRSRHSQCFCGAPTRGRVICF